MPRYLILRTFEVAEGEMPAVGRRSRAVIENHLPDVTWEHSHVLVDDADVERQKEIRRRLAVAQQVYYHLEDARALGRTASRPEGSRPA